MMLETVKKIIICWVILLYYFTSLLKKIPIFGLHLKTSIMKYILQFQNKIFLNQFLYYETVYHHKRT